MTQRPTSLLILLAAAGFAPAGCSDGYADGAGHSASPIPPPICSWRRPRI